MRPWLVVAGCLVGGLAWAQQSPSYKLQESVLNNGGSPAGGAGKTSSR